MDYDMLTNLALFTLGALCALIFRPIRAILIEIMLHPLRTTRVEIRNDHSIKIVAS